jgi:hypothetical protein
VCNQHRDFLHRFNTKHLELRKAERAGIRSVVITQLCSPQGH